tara:strand:- start:5624 stop:7975 length:2352 start_codon:yes stop_codon:yes gene_type:complete
VKDLTSYYQLPEDIAPAGEISVESDLLDYETGVLLIDGNTQSGLTGETFETVVSASGVVYPTLIANELSSPVIANVINQKQSEVDTSLLGIPRSEVALGLFDAVNIYGVNSKEWTSDSSYTYYQDPTDWTFRDSYGNYTRHVPAESAVQAYCYPPPVSFAFPFDDNSGRFPGGYTNGSMSASWESKRSFRYQPGRVNGMTFGIRMSTGSDWDGEIIQWGCRNSYGDGYYFQLEKGTDLYIVYTSPNGTFKIPRDEWNGDLVSIDRSATGWVLDLSRVTMFKVEYSWYGAVGARFLAYVPVGNSEARWVVLHDVLASNTFELPSLRSPFFKIFTQVSTTAGCPQAAFINLYGSSVYIDGGDKGTVTLGTAVLNSEKNIDSTGRSILGLQVKGQINGVDNQKTVYPVSLAAYASVNARFDLMFQGNGTGAGEHYYYGNGTTLSRGASSTIAVTRVGGNDRIWQGTFPNVANEVSGSTNYLSDRRAKVTGAGIYNTHIVAVNSGLTQITTDRALPSSTTSIRLSRMDASAVSTISIPSGISTGTVFFTTGGGQWRLGAWPESSGLTYTTSGNVLWFASKYTGLNFDRDGTLLGESAFPNEPYQQAGFNIAVSSGTNTSTLNFGGRTLTVSGTNPWPIAIVAEVMDSSQLNDVVLAYGAASALTTQGSGSTTAITTWTVSGVTQSATAAGGTSYVANKFENDPSSPLSAVLTDKQGYRTLYSPQRVATFFIGSGETKQFDLSNVFGPDKMFITGAPGTVYNSGALFLVATARTGSGIASATLNWEEQ